MQHFKIFVQFSCKECRRVLLDSARSLLQTGTQCACYLTNWNNIKYEAQEEYTAKSRNDKKPKAISRHISTDCTELVQHKYFAACNHQIVLGANRQHTKT